MSTFTYHSPNRPCPVCGGVSDCRSNVVNGASHCHRGDRVNPPLGWRYVKDDAQGFGIFFLEDDSTRDDSAWKRRVEEAETRRKARKAAQRAARLNGEEPPPAPKTWSQRAFEDVLNEKQPLTARQRERLCSEYLGRDDFNPELLGTEFISNDGNNFCAFVFPMKKADGTTIGASLRYRTEDYDKKGRGKETRGKGDGLFLPVVQVGELTSPIFLPEGASDTITLLSMGLCAVGRPNDKAGVHHMVELLRHAPAGRRIVIVAENDRKESGRWPGREGAEHVARQLAVALDRVVYVALPPNGYKDAREFAVANQRTSLVDLGNLFLEHAQATAEPFTPFDSESTASITATATTSATAQGIEIPASLRDFRAIDAHPSTPSCPPAPEPARCPTPKQSLYRNDCLGRTMIMFHPCRRLVCPVCRETKKQQYIATVEHHLGDHAKRATSNGFATSDLHLFWCHESDWGTVSAALRDEHADYFRLNPGNLDGNFMVIATHRPATKLITAHQVVTVETAERKLCSAIDHLPHLAIKGFTSSRAWKLIDNVTRGTFKGWRRICGLASSVDAILRILDHHKITRQPIIHQGMFWGWKAWQWADGANSWHAIVDDLLAGEVISNIEFESIMAAFSGPPIVTAQPPPVTADW